MRKWNLWGSTITVPIEISDRALGRFSMARPARRFYRAAGPTALASAFSAVSFQAGFPRIRFRCLPGHFPKGGFLEYSLATQFLFHRPHPLGQNLSAMTIRSAAPIDFADTLKFRSWIRHVKNLKKRTQANATSISTVSAMSTPTEVLHPARFTANFKGLHMRRRIIE